MVDRKSNRVAIIRTEREPGGDKALPVGWTSAKIRTGDFGKGVYVLSTYDC